MTASSSGPSPSAAHTAPSARAMPELPLVLEIGGHAPRLPPFLDGSPSALRALVGGKAASLIALSDAGLPVPPGFVLTTAAFELGLEALLHGCTSLVDVTACLERDDLELPPALVAAISTACDRLAGLSGAACGALSLAVRSSATDEDGAQRSFAGQQTTRLGVRGTAALLTAVREVWASLFARDALLYRERQRLDAPPPSMAVLVQPLVEAQVAGVLFTRSPVAPAERDEAMVCAAYGLGETVVAGHAADTFTVDRESQRVLRREVARKELQRRVSDDGSCLVTAEVAADAQQRPSLTDAQLAEVVALGRRVEAAFGGAAQDIEFAFDASGRLTLLQARPITGGVAAEPAPPTTTGHTAALYSNANVGEALPGVGTPMTWSIIHAFARRGFETAFGALGLEVPEHYRLVASFRGRVYLNISEFVSVASQIPLLTGETLAQLAGVTDASGLGGTFARLSPASFLGHLPITVPKLALSQLSMPVRTSLWSRRFGRVRDAFFAQPLGALDRAALQRALQGVDEVFNRTGEVMLSASSNFLMSYVVVREALRWFGGQEAARKESVLFSGLTGVESAAPGLELLAMAREVRDDAALYAIFTRDPQASGAAILEALAAEPAGRALRARLDGFLERWGHRALREAEIATPRWREDPSFLIGVIRRHLCAPRLASPQEVEREQSASREEATQVIRQHFLTGVGLAFRGLLRWAQFTARKREHLRARVVDTLSMYRHVLLEVGRRMVAAGALCEVDDVFFLTHAEVHEWLRAPTRLERTVRTRVAFRRALYQAFVESPDPPDNFVLRQGQDALLERAATSTAAVLPDDATVLTGLPGSPGRVTGPARVIDTPEGSDIPIHPGEVLVTTFTDVGWTPLFLVAVGVVTDRGGPLSHSCVVAREYGIPAVVGVGDATRLIRTGDIVTVDGQAGTVHVARGGLQRGEVP